MAELILPREFLLLIHPAKAVLLLARIFDERHCGLRMTIKGVKNAGRAAISK